VGYTPMAHFVVRTMPSFLCPCAVLFAFQGRSGDAPIFAVNTVMVPQFAGLGLNYTPVVWFGLSYSHSYAALVLYRLVWTNAELCV
jgi:hypothetical protein